MLPLQLLRGQAEEAGRENPPTACQRSDVVRAVAEDGPKKAPRQVMGRQNRKVGVVRAGWADHCRLVVPGPGDPALLGQPAAVLAHGHLLPHAVPQLGLRSPVGEHRFGLLHGGHGRDHHALGELLVPGVQVDGQRAWRVVGVGGGNEQAFVRDAADSGDGRADLFDNVPGQREHVAGEDAERGAVVDEEEGGRAKGSFERPPRGERNGVQADLAGRGSSLDGCHQMPPWSSMMLGGIWWSRLGHAFARTGARASRS